jgi:hypothetical protein
MIAASRRAHHSSKEPYQLSISVTLRNPIKRRPRPEMGWSAIQEEEEEGICLLFSCESVNCSALCCLLQCCSICSGVILSWLSIMKMSSTYLV